MEWYHGELSAPRAIYRWEYPAEEVEMDCWNQFLKVFCSVAIWNLNLTFVDIGLSEKAFQPVIYEFACISKYAFGIIWSSISC